MLYEFPEEPEGFNPITRRVETVRTDSSSHDVTLICLYQDEEPYSNVISEIDGFRIVVQHEDDEPLHISRDPEEKVVMPDYTGRTVPLFFCSS